MEQHVGCYMLQGRAGQAAGQCRGQASGGAGRQGTTARGRAQAEAAGGPGQGGQRRGRAGLHIDGIDFLGGRLRLTLILSTLTLIACGAIQVARVDTRPGTFRDGGRRARGQERMVSWRCHHRIASQERSGKMDEQGSQTNRTASSAMQLPRVVADMLSPGRVVFLVKGKAWRSSDCCNRFGKGWFRIFQTPSSCISNPYLLNLKTLSSTEAKIL